MVSTTLSRYLVLSGFALIGALLFALPLFTAPQTAKAGGECDPGWETPFSLEGNPYPPFTGAHAAWSAIYGESRIVYANNSFATAPAEGGCGGLEESDYLPTAFIVATPNTITAGQESELNWYSANVESCSINNGIGNVEVGSGSSIVSPAVTTTYTISCTGPSGPASASATVTVTESPAVLPTATLTANPASVTSGTPSSLTWTSTNATSCSINQSVGTVTPTAGGSTSVIPDVTTTYTLTCINATGQATAAATVTVTAGTGPDLTASSVSPSSVVMGVATTLSATISNIGTAASGALFANAFQIDSNSDHTSGVTTVAGSVSPDTAAGASNSTTVNRTFATAGTWYVRACADSNTSLSGTIAETVESNNCGSWTAITVTDPAAGGGGSVSCTVSDTTVDIGEQVTYTAVPAGGASSPYVWTDTPDAGTNLGSGTTVNRTYTTAGTYAMQVSATSASSPAFCSNVTVVDPAAVTCPGTPTAAISAAPNRIRSGNTSTITWSAQNVQGSCTITGPGLSQSATAASCTVPSTSATVTITAQSVYRITCVGATASTVVNLLPLIEEF